MNFSIKNLSLSVGKKTLLEQVNLEVTPGEMLVVMGSNGAGKSSLLRVLANEHRLYQGELALNGKPYKEWSDKQRAHMLAILPQSSSLNFAFTVLEVVMLGRLPHKTGHKVDTEIAMQAIDRFGLSHLIDAHYPALSGGEKQRVQLARVAVQIWQETPLGHRYLLLDEPTSALDVEHQQLVLNYAKELSQQGVGVMAILHDLNLASQYADRLVMLQKGHVAAMGSVEEVLTETNIKQLFSIDVSIIPHPVSQKPLVVTL